MIKHITTGGYKYLITRVQRDNGKGDGSATEDGLFLKTEVSVTLEVDSWNKIQ